MISRKVKCPYCGIDFDPGNAEGPEVICPVCKKSFIRLGNKQGSSSSGVSKKSILVVLVLLILLGGGIGGVMHYRKVVKLRQEEQRRLALQKKTVESMLESLGKKKQATLKLFRNLVSDYRMNIGDKRMEGIPSLEEIFQSAYDFSLPEAKIKRAALEPRILAEVREKIPISQDEYKKSRRAYYEKDVPLYKEGDMVSVVTVRQRKISGIFRELKQNGRAVKIGTAMIYLDDLDPAVAMRFDRVAREKYISDKLSLEENFYQSRYQDERDQLSIKYMTDAGYFYHKGNFYSPKELFELSLQ